MVTNPETGVGLHVVAGPVSYTHLPVYVSMRTELETMAGKKVYKRLAAYLDERTAPRAQVTLLPHPTVRR